MKTKLSRRNLLMGAMAAPVLISGCGRDRTAVFGLRHSFHLGSQSGESDISSVTIFRVTYRPDGMPLTNTYLTASFEGQMPFSATGQDGLLATTFPLTHLLMNAMAHEFQPRRSGGSIGAGVLFDYLPSQVGQPMFDLPRQIWPLVVLFTNRLSPLSVREVFPTPPQGDSAAGIEVLGYRVGLTDAEPSVGLEDQLPWLAQAGARPFGNLSMPSDPPNVLANKLYASQFLRT